jgi:hypothetical protein
MDPTLTAQIQLYQPWLIIAGVFVFFLLLRVTRKRLRQRVDEFGYRLLKERGSLIWFWMNAPGVMLHELSHAFVVLLFSPFGFRITSIALFRIKPIVQRESGGRNMKMGGRQSLQLGEVQYVRPQGRFMSYVGDGLSGIAPLFGGIGMLLLLYWVATGYNLWDIQQNLGMSHFHLFRPGWPWWTLIFAPYLILTITSELWPSRQDWRGARWFVAGVLLLASMTLVLLWLTRVLVFNHVLLDLTSSIAAHVDFALLVLLALDLVFLGVAEVVAHLMR